MRPSRSATVRSSRAATAGSWVTTTSVAPRLLRVEQEVESAAELSVVQRAGRLVGEDQPGPVDEGPGDGHALALPARQLVRQLVGRSASPSAPSRARPRS